MSGATTRGYSLRQSKLSIVSVCSLDILALVPGTIDGCFACRITVLLIAGGLLKWPVGRRVQNLQVNEPTATWDGRSCVLLLLLSRLLAVANNWRLKPRVVNMGTRVETQSKLRPLGETGRPKASSLVAYDVLLPKNKVSLTHNT